MIVQSAIGRRVGAVVIGRNEGDRLRLCLNSLREQNLAIVYVDSGSTDGSVALARSLDCDAVSLDPAHPFTAAAARNAGFARLLEIMPTCELVQFVDGDCVVERSWIPAAVNFLRQYDQYAVACGRRRERNPHISLYNRLCDLEWNTPVGDSAACGGDALMRVAALRQVGCFDGCLIAGEEPELCSRLRRAGWRIMRLDHEMTVHDANMLQFTQWWRRSKRAGWSFLNGAVMDLGRGGFRWAREALRPWIWCLALPGLCLVLALSFGWWGLLPLALYLLVIARSARHAFQADMGAGTALLFGVLCLVGKFAELQGQLGWITDKILERTPRLIEYKKPA